MSTPTAVRYRFEHFELQPGERRLLAAGTPVALAPRAFNLLLALVEREGHLATKEYLLEQVWPGVIVEENTLHQHISALRKVLGANAITTVPGTGYRFALGPVRTGEASAPTPGPVPRHNLVRQLTSFIGREPQIAELKDLLRQTQLLTLSGAGGCGKTRLALELAIQVSDAYSDGVWLVELAALADEQLVPQTVADVLGLRERVGESLTRTLLSHLAPKHLLLVLDNTEHLLAACAELARTLLQRCDRLTVLVTSRERLGVPGELTYRVPSLSVPDPKQKHVAETLAAYESARLFIERARFQQTHFAVTERSAPAIASICAHLDGIPLAIELAAARIRALSVEEVNQRLDQRFRLLTDSSRTALPRHRTLRSMIDWSYDLLDESEKLFLQRLSVFVGGWTLAAAEEVCAGEGIEQRDVLALLTSLADKSMVVPEQEEAVTRYRLLETVRQYARDRLEDGGASAAARVRHRDYYLALAEAADPKLKGAEQAQWLRRLEEEHDNVRAGLEWSLEEAGSKGGLRLCGALGRFWRMRGYFTEGREWCTRILCKTGAEERTRERADVLDAAGVLSYHQDYPAAKALHQEAVAIRRELGDRHGIAVSLGNLGAVAQREGDYPAARALYEESLAIHRELGDQHGIAVSLGNLGDVAFREGDYRVAKALTEESLSIFRELGYRNGIAMLLGNLGYWACTQDDYSTAKPLFEESMAIYRELGNRSGIASALSNLGSVALNQGDYSGAKALCDEGLAISREVGQLWSIPYKLDGLAAVVASLRDPLRAARIWGATERWRPEIGFALTPNERSRHDRRVAAARIASGDGAAFDSAWQEGRGLTLDQAIKLALAQAG